MKLKKGLLMATGLFFAGASVQGMYERFKEDKDIGVRGRVIKKTHECNGDYIIYVKGIQYEDTHLDKAIVHADTSTILIRKYTDDIACVNDIKEDSLVEVIIENIINNDEIMEVKAKKILILS